MIFTSVPVRLFIYIYHFNEYSLADVVDDLKTEYLTCYYISVISCYYDGKY